MCFGIVFWIGDLFTENMIFRKEDNTYKEIEIHKGKLKNTICIIIELLETRQEDMSVLKSKGKWNMTSERYGKKALKIVSGQ